MKFSALTPLGQLAFSGASSDAAAIYGALSAQVEEAFDMPDGTHVAGSLVARAVALAGVQASLRSIENAQDPARTNFNLEGLEQDYGVVPAFTLEERIANVQVAQALPGGAGRTALEAALTALLGSDFVATRTLSELSTTYPAFTGIVPIVWPASPDLGPGVWLDPRVPPKRFQVIESLGVGTFTAHYANLSQVELGYGYPTDDVTFLSPGDVAMLDAANLGRTEKVTITSVNNSFSAAANGWDYPQATFTTTSAHDALSTLCTGFQPLWISERRVIYVIVTPAAARNPLTRARIHKLMSVMTRGVTWWLIAEKSGSNTIGPWTCGSPLGSIPLGTVYF